MITHQLTGPLGPEGTGYLTDNGERLLNFCAANKLKIGGSLFRHKVIHKWTWRSPDQRTANQSDHICISKRWSSSLRDVQPTNWDVRVFRGADITSDHYLLIATVQLKLKQLTRKAPQKILNVEKLSNPAVEQQFRQELRNRVDALSGLENVGEEDIEFLWTCHRESFVKAAGTTIGNKRGKKKERWISDETWKAIDERKSLKIKKENT